MSESMNEMKQKIDMNRQRPSNGQRSTGHRPTGSPARPTATSALSEVQTVCFSSCLSFTVGEVAEESDSNAFHCSMSSNTCLPWLFPGKQSHHKRDLSRSKQGAHRPYAHRDDILPVSVVSPLGKVISWIHLLAAASSCFPRLPAVHAA